MKKPMVCPRCKENELSDIGLNALSRRDNKTEICSPCGTAEAFEDYSREESINELKARIKEQKKYIQALEDKIISMATIMSLDYNIEIEDDLFDNIVDNFKQKYNKKGV